MKRIIFILSCSFLFSCTVKKASLSPFVAVYKSDWIGNLLPAYILLRTQPKVFEIYAPRIYGSFFGQWNISNDTLFLFPEYEYFSRNSELKLSVITPTDSTIATIPQQYIIKDDCLIDITNYSTILPEPFNKQIDKIVYKRVKNK